MKVTIQKLRVIEKSTRKSKITVFLILIFSFSVFSQTKNLRQLENQIKEFKSSRLYSIEYNSIEDLTLTKFTGFDIIPENLAFRKRNSTFLGSRFGVPVVFYLGAGFIFRGQTLKQSPDSYLLYISYSSNLDEFITDLKLNIRADREDFQFDNPKITDHIKHNGLSKPISYQLTRQQMEKIANAKFVTVKIGTFKRPLPPKIIEAFRNLLKLGTI